jgi:biotin transport system substrate-specific component
MPHSTEPPATGTSPLSGLVLPIRSSWPVALATGVVLVALSAQIAIPLPFTPVPMTLQGLAVILVGGLFGATAGAASMTLYLLLGAFGVPVFAFGGAGLARLLGPTGGYLLAFPIAAFITGRVALRDNLPRSFVGSLLGMAAIHAAGVAQLAILTGGAATAVRAGALPFAAADLLKVVIAALILWRYQAGLRPRG